MAMRPARVTGWLVAFLFAGVLVCPTWPGAASAGDGGSDWRQGDEPKPKRTKKGSNSNGGGKGGTSSGNGKVDMSDIPPDTKAEKKDKASLGESFNLKRTAHYSVFYDTSEDDLRVFAAAIEMTYRSCMNYTQKLGFTAHPPERKLLIYYFEHHKDYSDYAERIGKGPQPQSTPGLYFPDLNRSMFYNFRNQESLKKLREESESKIAQLREQLKQTGLSTADRKRIGQEIADARRMANRSNVVGGDISESIVQHEVAHQVLWNIGFHNPKNFFANPRWLAEGTAMMFEPISTGNSANFGRVNEDRLKEFRMLRESGRLIPVRDFIATHGWFGPQTIDVAYPQAWAIVHYLNRTKRSKLRKYVELVNKRPADYKPEPAKEIADFEKCFGKIDQKWVDAWDGWMKNVR